MNYSSTVAKAFSIILSDAKVKTQRALLICLYICCFRIYKLLFIPKPIRSLAPNVILFARGLTNLYMVVILATYHLLNRKFYYFNCLFRLSTFLSLLNARKFSFAKQTHFVLSYRSLSNLTINNPKNFI